MKMSTNKFTNIKDNGGYQFSVHGLSSSWIVLPKSEYIYRVSNFKPGGCLKLLNYNNLPLYIERKK